MKPTVRTATGLIATYMRTFGFEGWASLWRTVYLLPGYESDEGLIRHEAMHLEQMERDGRVLFMVRYVWWLIRYGYQNNPYEVEARAAQTGFHKTSEALMR